MLEFQGAMPDDGDSPEVDEDGYTFHYSLFRSMVSLHMMQLEGRMHFMCNSHLQETVYRPINGQSMHTVMVRAMTLTNDLLDAEVPGVVDSLVVNLTDEAVQSLQLFLVGIAARVAAKLREENPSWFFEPRVMLNQNRDQTFDAQFAYGVHAHN